MQWLDDVIDKNDREAKRLWLAGTIAAGMCASAEVSWKTVPAQAVELADAILGELTKGDMK